MFRFLLFIASLLLAFPTYGFSIVVYFFIRQWMNKNESEAMWRILNYQMEYSCQYGHMETNDFFMTRGGVKKFFSMYSMDNFHMRAVSDNENVTYSGVVFFNSTEITILYFTYPNNSYRKVSVDCSVASYEDIIEYANHNIVGEVNRLAQEQNEKAKSSLSKNNTEETKEENPIDYYGRLIGVNFMCFTAVEIISLLKHLIKTNNMYFRNECSDDTLTDKDFIEAILSSSMSNSFMNIYYDVEKDYKMMDDYISESGVDFDPDKYADDNLNKFDIFMINDRFMSIGKNLRDKGEDQSLPFLRYTKRMDVLDGAVKALGL